MKLHLFTKEQLETIEAASETSNMAARAFHHFCEDVKRYNLTIKNSVYIHDAASESGLLSIPDDDCTTIADAAIAVFDHLQNNDKAKRLLEASNIVYGFPYSSNGNAIVFILGGETKAAKQIEDMRVQLKLDFLETLIEEYQQLQVNHKVLEEEIKKLST